MIRRPPTSISLSNRDITEHFEKIDRRKAHEQEDLQLAKGLVLSYPQLVSLGSTWTGDRHHGESENEANAAKANQLVRHEFQWEREDLNSLPLRSEQEQYSPNSNNHPRNRGAHQTRSDNSPPRPGIITTLEARIEPVNEGVISARPLGSSAGHDAHPLLCCHDDIEHSRQDSTNVFDYGGFVESLVDESPSAASPRAVASHSIDMPEVQRLRSRVPLPRSPLFRSHGAQSPEKAAVHSAAPRVASYGATGLLLSPSARQPRNYRPRTISYSFDESERANAAYEQVQASDSESVGSRRAPEERRSLHEELHGTSSLYSTSLQGDVPSSPPEFRQSHRSPSMASPTGLAHTSPQLPLPPPFSAVPRNLSRTSSSSAVRGGGMVTARSSSTSPPRFDGPQMQVRPTSRSSGVPLGVEHTQLASSRILHSLATLPYRLLSAYRSRSPFQPQVESMGIASTSPARQRSPPHQSPPRTSSTAGYRPFQPYDDRVPASLQPQTPQQLPEARHQSRFHPSYTAPTGGRIASPRLTRTDARRRRGTRSDSPAGLDTPGFRGLYGGRENSDDEAMFDRASRRLWALSSARRTNHSISHNNNGIMGTANTPITFFTSNDTLDLDTPFAGDGGEIVR